MKSSILLCVFALILVGGCGSSEPSSVADGLEQSEIDEYNAMIADEAKRSKEAGEIGANE